MSKQKPSILKRAISDWIAGRLATLDDSSLSEAVNLQALEDRVLYSAGPIPIPMDGSPEVVDTTIDANDCFAAIEANIEFVAEAIDAFDSPGLEFLLTEDVLAIADLPFSDFVFEPGAVHELVIVDTSVENYEFLVDDLLSAATDRSLEVVYVEPNSNGIDRFSQLLATRSNLDAVHLISHGQDGELRLGNSTLRYDNLERYASDISSWKHAFNEDADFLIYGCDVAQTEIGEHFVERLAELTEADFGASSDLTGHQAQGGDWIFEFQTGRVESDLIFSEFAQSNWMSTLGPIVASDTGATGPSIASDYFGNVSIVVASSEIAGSVGDDVYLSQVDTTGTYTLADLRVNTTTAGNQNDAVVAMNDSGDFVVVWTSDASGESQVYAQIYDSDGSVEAAEFRVNAVGTIGGNASVAMSNEGEILIAWQGSGVADAEGIYAKRFDKNGAELSAELIVNSVTAGFQGNPEVDINNNGEFIVSWDSSIGSASDTEARFAVFDADDAVVIAESISFQQAGYYFTETAVSINDNRDLVLTATSNPTDGTTGTLDITARAIQWSGTWDGSGGTTFSVHDESLARGDQSGSSVTIANNEIVIAWEGEASDSSDTAGVYVRKFDLTGVALTSETKLGPDAPVQQQPFVTHFHNQEAWALVWAETNGPSTSLEYSRSQLFSNASPTGSNETVNLQEDGRHVLEVANFGYADSDSDPLAEIEITLTPTTGVLLLNGIRVQSGDEISRSDLDAGNLVYLPDSNTHGSDSFDFKVNDGYSDADSSNTLTLNVTAVADGAIATAGDFLVSVDGPMLVNDSISESQTDFEITALQSGGYVVTWVSEFDSRVYFQVYDAAGSKLGEQEVAPSQAGVQSEPDIVGLNGGGFVIAWSNTDGPSSDVLIQRFDDLGNAVQLSGSGTGPFAPTIASQNSEFDQGGAAIAALADGGFVLSWATLDGVPGGDSDIAARIFTGNGGVSDEFIVNTTILGDQRDPIVTAIDGNRFVIGWVDQSVNDYDVMARIFESGDPASGTEFTLNANTADRDSGVELTGLANGNFLATWVSPSGKDGDGSGLLGAIFDESGVRVSGADLVLNPTTALDQQSQSVIALGDGGFMAFWQSDLGDADGTGIIGARFDATGTAGIEFVVNSGVYGDQTTPRATHLSNGQIAIAWGSPDGDQGGTDFGQGIYLDRFEFALGGDEDSNILLNVDVSLIDQSENLTSMIVGNIPNGAVVSDGFGNTSTIGDASIDITSWDLATLKVTPPTNSNVDFELTMTAVSTEPSNSDTSISVQTIHVILDPVADPIVKSDWSVTTIADATLDISLGELTSGSTNPDSANPSVSPDRVFDSSTLPPTAVGGGKLQWSPVAGDGDITFDNGTTYVTDTGADIAGVKQAFELDGTVGAEVNLDSLTEFGDAGMIELWIRPTDVLGNRVLFEWGETDEGFAIYQEGDKIVAKIHQLTTIDGRDTEPYVLIADGLSTTDFNQIVLMISSDSTTVLGDPGKTPDVQLFLNGQLRDQLIDLPGYDDKLHWHQLTENAGLGKTLGTTVGDIGYGNFVGQIARVDIFGETKLAANQEVEERYQQSIAAPNPTQIDGQAFTPGAVITLGSGATVTINADRSLTYDPNGAFDHVLAGQTDQDSFTYELGNGMGASETVIVTVDIAGPDNVAPTIAVNLGLTVAEGAIDTVIASTMLDEGDPDDDGANLTYTITSNVINGTLKRNGTGLTAGGTFTQADLDANLVTYSHDGSETIADQFSFSLADGGEDGAMPATGTFAIEVTPVNDAPTDLSTGVELNADGGNDLYFAVNNGAATNLLNGKADLTVETTFAIATAPSQSATLFSYNVGTVDEFTVEIANSGEIQVTVKGSTFDSNNNYAQLLNGAKHHVAVTWDAGGGVLQLYVDGQFVETIYNVRTGSTLGNNGVLVLGQESAAAIGGFDADQTFQGTFYDVRIWDSVRSSSEIENNHAHQLDGNDYPSRLIANWQMKDLTGPGSDQIVDLVSPGANDLTLTSIGSVGAFSNSVANDGLSIIESASDGDSIGFVTPTDVEYFHDIVEDGSFNSTEVTNANFTSFAFDGSEAGDQFGPWEVVANAIDVRGSNWESSPLGGHAVDLSGGSPGFGNVNGRGIIEQVLATTIGQEYQISFEMSGNFEAGGSQHRLSVNIDGAPTQFSFDRTAGWSRSNLDWETNSLTFVATTTTTDLQFEALTGTTRGAIIGDVQVVESTAPPPSFTYQMLDDAGGRFQIDSLTGEITVLDSSLLDSMLNGQHDVIVQVTDSSGPVYQKTISIDVESDGLVDLSGRVLEDVNGDAQLGDGVGVAGATVHLYLDDGDGIMGAGDLLVRTVQTDSVGNYEFLSIDGTDDYWVAVDSKTITTSQSLNGGYVASDSWAEQTYGDGAAMFGGLVGGVSDDASGLLTSQHVSFIEMADADVSNVDFGFSFNVVTNSLGGGSQDDDPGANQRSVQGSLRQFITNANAIDGDNAMRFVPVTTADRVDGADSRWEILVSVALPSLEDNGTTIDGRAFENDGISLRDANTGTLGSSQSVGVGADGIAGTGDEPAIDGVDAPELEITDVGGVANGFTVLASDTEIANLAIHGFGQIGTAGGNIFVDGSTGSITGTHIHDNVIGSRGDSFALPNTSATQSINIYVLEADNGLIEGNLIGFAAESGIQLKGSSDFSDGANDWVIRDNEIRSNARTSVRQDGINIITGSQRIIASNNLIVGNGGYGIDSWKSFGDNQFFNNTIQDNGGGGVETGGIPLQGGGGSSVEFNVISNNIGPGVHVVGRHEAGSTTFSASVNNLISKNSFESNSGVAIDLSDPEYDSGVFNRGDGVTLNDTTTDGDMGNLGLDHPVLSSAFIAADGLHVFGTFESSQNIDRLEFYLASSGAGDSNSGTEFGEGVQFLGDVSTVALISYNPATGEFAGLVNEPASGWPPEIYNAGSITAIAIQSTTQNTSEFGNNEEVDVPPIALNSLVDVMATQPYLFERTDFGYSDVNLTDYDSITIKSIPSGGVLYLDGVTVSINQTISGADIDLGKLTYQPLAGASGVGYDDFDFAVRDQHQASLVDATLTIDILPFNDNPVFSTPQDWFVDENQNTVGTIAATDTESPSVTYSITGGVDGGYFAINSNTGELGFMQGRDYEAPVDGNSNNVYRVIVRANDGTGGTTDQLVRVHIEDVDENPIANDDTYLITSGQSFLQDVTLNDSDPELTELTVVTIVQNPTSGTVTIDASGLIHYQHGGSLIVQDQFTYQVVDATGLTDTATVFVRPAVIVGPPTDDSDDENEANEDDKTGGGNTSPSEPVDPPEELIKPRRLVYADLVKFTAGSENPSLQNDSFGFELDLESSTVTYAYAGRGEDFSFASLATEIVTTKSKEEVSQFETTLLAALIWEDLDSAKREFLQNRLQIGMPKLAASAASFLTVGYLAWIIRGGVLLTTFMSSIPTWSAFDIQSLIDSAAGNDQSIEQMVDH